MVFIYHSFHSLAESDRKCRYHPVNLVIATALSLYYPGNVIENALVFPNVEHLHFVSESRRTPATLAFVKPTIIPSVIHMFTT